MLAAISAWHVYSSWRVCRHVLLQDMEIAVTKALEQSV